MECSLQIPPEKIVINNIIISISIFDISHNSLSYSFPPNLMDIQSSYYNYCGKNCHSKKITWIKIANVIVLFGTVPYGT